MSNYHRYTHGDCMSEWGHAMFAKGDAFRVSFYGPRHYIFRPAPNTPHISEILPEIKKRILRDIEQGWSNHSIDREFEYLRLDEVDIDYILAQYNPDDIVDSAGAWDTYYFVAIAWEVMEDLGITAVLLDDGAIVFDPDLCDEVEWVEAD